MLKPQRYRAFAAHQPGRRALATRAVRITVEGSSGQDCEARIAQICRDYCLPIKRTIATIQRVRPQQAPEFRPMFDWR